MKFCSKCDMAWYCWRKCQIMDWETSHRLSCHEIVSLRHSILRVSEEYEQQKLLLKMNSLADLKMKMALLELPYLDPYHCSNCKISASNEMKFCSKCELAWYCSRKCQIDDWKISHRFCCRGIVLLKDSISYLEDQQLKMLQDINEEMGWLDKLNLNEEFEWLDR